MRKTLTSKVVYGSYRLDARKAATGNHKGQHSFPPHRVTLHAGAFQHGDYRSSEHDGVAETLEAHRMLGHTRDAGIVGLRTERQNEMVVR